VAKVGGNIRYGIFVPGSLEEESERNAAEESFAFAGPLQPVFTKMAKIAKSEWVECRDAPDGNFKRKLYDMVQSGMDRLDPVEVALFSVSKASKTKDVEVLIPKSLSEREARDDLLSLVRTQKERLKRLGIVYTVATPLSALAAILPGPNIFFAANALRIYHIYLAYNAADNFEGRIAQPLECTNSLFFTHLDTLEDESPSVGALDLENNGNASPHGSNGEFQQWAVVTEIELDESMRCAGISIASDTSTKKILEAYGRTLV
jgi:hypothetical protein